MRGQIGSWDEFLVITLETDALEWLDSHDCDRRVLIDVDNSSRVVTVMPDIAGHKVGHRGVRNAVLNGVSLGWHLIQGPKLPRFELMAIDLDPSEGVALEIGVPIDHLLSWPRLRDCSRYSAAEVACSELERRIQSAAKFYGPDTPPRLWSWVTPPKDICALFPRGFWAHTLHKALKEMALQAKTA